MAKGCVVIRVRHIDSGAINSAHCQYRASHDLCVHLKVRLGVSINNSLEVLRVSDDEAHEKRGCLSFGIRDLTQAPGAVSNSHTQVHRSHPTIQFS